MIFPCNTGVPLSSKKGPLGLAQSSGAVSQPTRALGAENPTLKPQTSNSNEVANYPLEMAIEIVDFPIKKLWIFS